MKLQFVSYLMVVFALACGTLTVFAQDVDVEKPNEIPSILLESVINADVAGIERALEANENINVQNVNGWTGALFAVAMGDINVLRSLIDHGIDLNIPNDQGVTPLMYAAKEADKEMVEFLLAHNADPLYSTADGQSAFSLAQESNRQVITLLLAEASVLHGMVVYDLDAVITGVRNGAFVNLRNTAGWTPLIFSVSRGNIESAEELLRFGANVNLPENDGWTPLHFAAEMGNESMVHLLMNNGADVNALTNDGRSPADLATFHSLSNIVDILAGN